MVDWIGTQSFVGVPVKSWTLPVSLTSLSAGTEFSSCSMTSINLESVTTIGVESFLRCRNLTSVNLSSAVTIGDSAFKECTALKNIYFKENRCLTSIGSMSFSYCKSLEELVLPTTNLDLMAWSFSFNDNLVSISFHGESSKYDSVDGCIYLKGKNTFHICPSGLSEVELLDTTETINTQAFYGCRKLVNVIMRKPLKWIEPGAFYGCSSIEMLRLPETVEFIGDAAFDNCPLLRKILYCNNKDCAQWVGDPFPTDPEIYTFSSYESADGTFCNHSCYKVLDEYCNIPTYYFTMPERVPVYEMPINSWQLLVGLFAYCANP